MRIKLSDLRGLIREAVKPDPARDFSSPMSQDPKYAGFDAEVDGRPDLQSDWGPSIPTNTVFSHEFVPAIFGFSKISWLKLAKKTKLPVDVIIPTQEHLLRDGLKRYARLAPKELPLVVFYNKQQQPDERLVGKYFAQDHTRIAVQILKGQKQIDVRLIEYVGESRTNDYPYRTPGDEK